MSSDLILTHDDDFIQAKSFTFNSNNDISTSLQGQDNPLGNYAKSTTLSKNKYSLDPLKIRHERYITQDKIQLLLNQSTNDDEFKNLKKCMRAPFSSAVSIHHNKEHNKAFYGNLIQCASVWGCPVCSAKIQARRALEISKAVCYAYHNKKKAIMITLTQPHTKEDSLADIVAKHKVAISKFKSGKQFTNFSKRTGCYGKIRSSECTYSNINGWHWHVHELWFVDESCDIEVEKQFLINKWYNACTKAGFVINDKEAFWEHSVDIIDEAHTSDYLAKSGQFWGIDKELVKGAAKKGHGKNPFDLANSNNKADNMRFVEYLQVTRGKAQLYWSPKLKSLVGVTDKTDEELVEEDKENAELIAFIEKDLWKCILNNGARSTILDIVEKHGFNGLREWFCKHGFQLDPPV